MSGLESILVQAVNTKPAFGEPCNHCGYCCLTEVCAIGRELTGSDVAPCKLLESRDGKHYCKLAETDVARQELGIGSGCDAKTQQEVINELMQ